MVGGIVHSSSGVLFNVASLRALSRALRSTTRSGILQRPTVDPVQQQRAARSSSSRPLPFPLSSPPFPSLPPSRIRSLSRDMATRRRGDESDGAATAPAAGGKRSRTGTEENTEAADGTAPTPYARLPPQSLTPRVAVLVPLSGPPSFGARGCSCRCSCPTTESTQVVGSVGTGKRTLGTLLVKAAQARSVTVDVYVRRSSRLALHRLTALLTFKPSRAPIAQAHGSTAATTGGPQRAPAADRPGRLCRGPHVGPLVRPAAHQRPRRRRRLPARPRLRRCDARCVAPMRPHPIVQPCLTSLSTWARGTLQPKKLACTPWMRALSSSSRLTSSCHYCSAT